MADYLKIKTASGYNTLYSSFPVDIPIRAGIYQDKTVTPSTSSQTVTPDSGYNALSSVTVNGDSDLIAGNIKTGVDIFGVTGTFDGGTLEAKTVSPSVSSQTVTPSSGNYGLSSVTVNGAPLESKTVTPSSSAQSVTPSSGYYGLSEVAISGDSDLVASNIKKDVDIFGVTGTFEGGTLESKTVAPSTTSQTVTPSSGYYGLSSVVISGTTLESKSVTPSASTQTVEPSSGYLGLSSVTINGDSGLVAGNIRSGVTIFGVTGVYDVGTPTPGSLIVCSCSSNIDAVVARYGSSTLSAYMSSNTAYVVIPYTYSGVVYLDGYYSGSVVVTEQVTISSIDKYEQPLSASATVYDSGTWYGVGDHTWNIVLSSYAPVEGESSILFQKYLVYTSSARYEYRGAVMSIPISTRGYSTLVYHYSSLGSSQSAGYGSTMSVGYCTSSSECPYYLYASASGVNQCFNYDVYKNSLYFDKENQTASINIASGVTSIYLAAIGELTIDKIYFE